MKYESWDKEKVWAALEAQLERQKRRRRAIILWWLLGTGTCMVLALCWLWMLPSANQEIARSEATSAADTAAHAPVPCAPAEQAPAKASREEAHIGEPSLTSSTHRAAPNARKQASAQAMQPSRTAPTTTTGSDAPVLAMPAEHSLSDLTADTATQAVADSSDRMYLPAPAVLPALSAQALTIYPAHYLPSGEQQEIVTSVRTPQAKRSVFVEAGSARAQVRFMGPDAYTAQREASERATFGWHAMVGAEHRLWERLGLWAGIRYEELFFIYDYSTVQTQQLLLPGEIMYDLPDGSSFTEPGSVPATETRTRQIVHNNRLKRFQFPLGMSYSMGKTQHRVLLRAGLHLRLWQQMDGVLLDASGQHLFDRNLTTQLHDPRNLALGGQVQLGYVRTLGGGWRVQALIDYAQDLGGQASATTGFARLNTLGVSLGVTRAWQ